jgi:hypothetical protein
LRDTQRLRLLRHNFRNLFAGIALEIFLAQECKKFFFKKYRNWCRKPDDFLGHEYYAISHGLGDGDADDFLHEKVPVLRAVNVNWNANYGNWNVNANSIENPNEWNSDNRVFSRNYCVSPAYFAGVFV